MYIVVVVVVVVVVVGQARLRGVARGGRLRRPPRAGLERYERDILMYEYTCVHTYIYIYIHVYVYTYVETQTQRPFLF